MSKNARKSGRLQANSTFLLLSVLVFFGPASAEKTPSTEELLRKIELLEQENNRLAMENQTLSRQIEQTPAAAPDAPQTEVSGDLFDLSLEQLMEVDTSSATLTETSQRKKPSAMTVITREDIQHSGARSLFELLEIYVPNFQWMFQGIFPRHMGMRGIIDGRDDKYLLLVNGRQMNEKTNFGVLTERDLPMLRDIQRIEVVRGPGSALYGPGALAMVINLVIDDPSSFEGLETSVRGGAVEEFHSGEFKWSKMFSENHGLLIYGGASEYDGASGEDSPLHFGLNGGVRKYDQRYYIDDEFTGPIKNYNQAYRDFPKMKYHAHYMLEDLNVWARYTQGGEYADQSEWNGGVLENGLVARDILYGMGYRQATLTSDYKQELTDDFSLNYRFSYDRTQVETTPYSVLREMSYREDEYQGRILAKWDINENHKTAFGGEWMHEEFGLDPDGRDTTLNYRMGDKKAMPRWNTDTQSLVGEYQWNITDQWTAFASGRLDNHTFAGSVFSPRAALVYTPDQKSTWKLMTSESSRTNVAQEMKLKDISGADNEYETLRAHELRYERLVSKQFSWAFSGFLHDHDVMGWSWTSGNPTAIGNFKSYGVELEGCYKTDLCKIRLSHAFTKLNEASLEPGITGSELVTRAPYEINFANWSDHQTKISTEHNLSDQLLLTNSMVIYWGYPGAEDYARDISVEAPAVSTFFGPSFFWNLGLEYQYSKNTTFRLDAYNILGWLDEDTGKRLFGFTYAIPAMYRVQPASFGFQMIHKF